MEKWEQDLKEQVNFSLPESINERIDLTLNRLKKEHKKTPKVLYGSIAVVASLALTVSAASLSPAFANAMRSIPFIGSVFELVGEPIVKWGRSEQELSTELGQQVQIGDDQVTFTESLYDGSKINLGFIVSTPDDDPLRFSTNLRYLVDGKRLTNYTGSSPAIQIEKGRYAGTLVIDPKEQLPDQFVLGVMSQDETTTYVQIPVERRGSYYEVPIAKSGIWRGIKMKYDTIALYPTTTELSFHLQKANTDEYRILKFKVSNEQGLVMRSTGASMYGFKDRGEYKYSFEPFEVPPKKVKIQPYISTAYTTTEVSAEWKGTPITISQGEVGSLIILDEKLDDDKLTLTFEVTGECISEQMERIWLYDGKGNPLPRVSPPIRISGTNKYQLTYYNVSNTDSIKISTPVFNPTNYLKDLEVSLELDK